MKDQVTSIERPLRLVNGKFMRGDVEEKPEIGNSEQIALLREFEQEAEKAEKAAKAGKQLAPCDEEWVRSYAADKLLGIQMIDKGCANAEYIIRLRKE